jgi:hypothetical protein
MPHKYTVKRKLQEQSGSFFVILPKIWVTSQGLKERDEMTVTFNDIVTINPQRIGKEVTS